MPVLISLLLFSLASGASDDCSLQQHQTKVRWGRSPTRHDRKLYVASADHACTRLRVPRLPGSSLETVRARVVRAEQRPSVFGSERLAPSEDGWEMHLPEVGAGDAVELSVRRSLKGPVSPWQPTGAAEASLTVRGPARLWSARSSSTHWWTERTSAPARVRVVTDTPAGVVLISGEQDPPDRGPRRPARTRAVPTGTTVVLIPEDKPFLPGEPPAGRTVQATFWDTPAAPAWHPGPGALQAVCTEGKGAVARLSEAISATVVPPSGTVVESVCAWTEGRLRVAGEQVLEGGAWRIEGPGLRVWSTAEDGGRDPEQPTLLQERAGNGLHEGPAGTRRVAWVLPALGGQAVLPNRSTALDRVAYSALRASLPEPGLPLVYKNRVPDAAFVEALLKDIRRDLRTDTLPGRGPLRPRRLVALKRAGWGTPWEQALLLSRLLRQARLPATPIPVRARERGELPPEIPVGYTDAVVFLEDIEQEVIPGWGQGHFLAPSCPVCAPGELPTGLWGGQVFADGRDALPSPPTAGIAIEHEQGNTTVALAAPAALALRLALLAQAPEERAEAVSSLIGLPHMSLIRHEGLETLGAPVTLVFDGAPQGSLTWRRETPVGLPRGAALPASVTARRRVNAQPGQMLVVQDGALRWEGRIESSAEGSVLVETLHAPAEEGLAIARQRVGSGINVALGSLLAAPIASPVDSTPAAPRDTLSPEVD